MNDLTQLFELYRQNIFSAMLRDFAGSLGLTPDPFLKLGIGYSPEDGSWILPERDSFGQIIGLAKRKMDGGKFMVKGSSRGFTYAVNPNFFSGSRRYKAGSVQWDRISQSTDPCPVCGRAKWCMRSQDGAVICCTKKKSKAPLGEAGWIHVLDSERYAQLSTAPVLYESEYPILITEGASDWAAATELGFVAIGRPQAKGREKELVPLLKGKKVIIFGDNDPSGVGRKGVEVLFSTICRDCDAVKAFPPPDIKDLRQWYTKYDLTQEQLLEYVADTGDAKKDIDDLEDNTSSNIAEKWLECNYTKNDMVVLRSYGKQWYEYSEGIYQQIDDDQIRGSLYNFLRNKYIVVYDASNTGKKRAISPTRNTINDIIDALNAYCPIYGDVPMWLSYGNRPSPEKLIAFKNGILDVKKYLADKVDYFYPTTPEYFTLTSIPHIYDPTIEPDKDVMEALHQIFNSEDQIELLQEWMGYSLIPSQEFEKMMLFVGPPRSGKGTVLELMTSLVGSTQVVSTSFASLCGDFGYAPLIGKLLAVLPDAAIPRYIDSTTALEKIKQITGGDPVGINRKYKNPMHAVKLTCRFTIAVNTLPELPDHAKALEPRLNIMRFENSFIGKEDRDLKRRLADKSSTMINWALLGLKRLYQENKFTIPKSSLSISKEFSRLSTPLIDFISDCCIIGNENSFTEKMQLYDCWCRWSDKEGAFRLSNPKFRQKFISLNLGVEVGHQVIGTSRVEGFLNIEITKKARMKYLGEPE